MLVEVYRSNEKRDTYLYVEHDCLLNDLPYALMHMLGDIEKVMDIDLKSRDRLAIISSDELINRIKTDGYWLQLPPTEGHILDKEQCPV